MKTDYDLIFELLLDGYLDRYSKLVCIEIGKHPSQIRAAINRRLTRMFEEGHGTCSGLHFTVFVEPYGVFGVFLNKEDAYKIEVIK